MRWWRISPNRLFKRGNRSSAGLLAQVLVFAVLLAALSGCGGRGLRHESWPGLLVDGDMVFAANLERVQALDAETGKLAEQFLCEVYRQRKPPNPRSLPTHTRVPETPRRPASRQ